MNCVYCRMYLAHARVAEYLIKGMSLCAEHFGKWEDGKFEVEDIEKGWKPNDN